MTAVDCGRWASPARPGPQDRAEPTYVRDAGEPAVIEGVRGKWRVEPALLDGLDDFEGRAALLSPFDRLVMDRKRLDALFGFDYLLEMYKPKEQRLWGYYALPILYGDRLVGKLDATAERAEGVLRVDAVHEDEPFTPAMTEAVDAEIDDLAAWLGLEVVRHRWLRCEAGQAGSKPCPAGGFAGSSQALHRQAPRLRASRRRARGPRRRPAARWAGRPTRSRPTAGRPPAAAGRPYRDSAQANAPRSESTVSSTSPPSRSRTQCWLATSAYQRAPEASKQMPSGWSPGVSAQTRLEPSVPSAAIGYAVSFSP